MKLEFLRASLLSMASSLNHFIPPPNSSRRLSSFCFSPRVGPNWSISSFSLDGLLSLPSVLFFVDIDSWWGLRESHRVTVFFIFIPHFPLSLLTQIRRTPSLLFFLGGVLVEDKPPPTGNRLPYALLLPFPLFR